MAQQDNREYKGMDSGESMLSPNVCPIIRNLLNGVKHTAESFAELHGLDSNFLEAVMKGEKAPTQDIVTAISNHPPLNVRDLYDSHYKEHFPIIDDTKGGVVYFGSGQRIATERIFKRGQGIPYYRYADTAMSRTSKFRPEWIQELYIHHGEDGNLQDWAFNKGHFEHQMTLFIGPVNFYWIDKQGKRHVQKMNTGDMNYITPFVPHSFATRLDGNGLILAVTYGGAIATEDFQSRIKLMTIDEYVSRTADRLPPIGKNLPTDENSGVIIRRYQDAKLIEDSVYLVRELMGGVPFQSHSKAFEYIVRGQKEMPEKVDADRWVYNIGDVPIILSWNALEQELEPGSSAFIQPNREHAFRNVDSKEGKLAVMQIKPNAGNPLEELALISRYAGDKGLRRVHSETTQWF